MSIYRLTTRAEDDLIDIFAFGIEQFGLRQALLYKSELAHCFQLLSQNPNMGRKAPKLGEQVHRHEHGSHVVLYEPDEEGILILAIVHGRSIRKLKI